MKDGFIQFILGIIGTCVGLLITMMFSIEEPQYVGESFSILFVGLINLFWFIPYYFIYTKKGNKNKLRFLIFIYIVFLGPFVCLRLYYRSFNTEKWKTEINYRHTYDNHPSHINGDMVSDIINSKMLIGLSREKVEKLLGNNYYLGSNNNTGTTLVYFYSHTYIFDGCDKLNVYMVNGKCTGCEFAGCD